MAGPVTAAPSELVDELAVFGDVPDQDIDLYEAALLFAAIFHPDIKLDRYRNHCKKLIGEVEARHEELLEAGANDSAETRVASLKHILADKYGYEGDTEDLDHIRNADLIDVIDRGRGNPVSLAVLYIHVALVLGWDAYGLNLPGYFAVRMDMGGQRLIFDPFERCRILQAPDLRRIVKQARGQHAELSSDYYEATPKRDILVRLQNHIKLRQIEMEDYEGALKSVEAMRAIDPKEYRLLLDAGVLYSRTNRREAAILALEDYISKVPDMRDRQEAAMLLQEIKQGDPDK